MKHLLLLLAFFAAQMSAQNVRILSDSAKVSLMTVAPGNEIYSIFGHSAIRVHDPINRLDRCYNYGTFDFEQPNFLIKFCRGKLLYSLDIESYRGFEYGNLHDERPMHEQLLNFDSTQKQRLYELLETNALPENRDYKYDFFYDNCATRIRDILQKTVFESMYYDTTLRPNNVTMRQLLKPYLVPHPWTDFGIDLVLGAAADHKASPADFMFLPDHLSEMMGAAKITEGKKLVSSDRYIPEQTPAKKAAPASKNPLDYPLATTSLLALVGLLCMANPRTERIFDAIFWFVLGIMGLIMALLWFATDHSATKSNLNILWAWPTHLFFFWRRDQVLYFIAAGIVAALTLIFWKFWPQQMPVAAIPIVILVIVKGLWRQYVQPTWRDGV